MLIETEELVKSTREAYGDALVELGKTNENIFVMDADLSESTKTNKFATHFPERFLNMGVAEQDMMGTAAGLALCGKIPIVSTFAVFATMRSGEQVRTSIAYSNLNVKIVVTHSGLSVGTAGATHFCEEDLAIMRSLPNMVVIAPADALETSLAIKAAVEHRGPVYVRLGRGEAPIIYKELNYEIGKAVTLYDGKDVTLIATGIMLGRALEAAKRLKIMGVEARVIDMHTIKPVDKEVILKAAEETKGIITLEDHNVLGGLGSAVAEVVAEENKTKVKRLGIPDTFCPIATPEQLWDYCGMAVENICDLARSLADVD